jgi:subtilisin family serine protease
MSGRSLNALLMKILAVCLIAGCFTVSASFAQSRGNGPEDFYYSNGKKVPVMVFLDRIGVITSEKVKPEQARAFIRSLGLRIIQEYPGGMVILGLNTAQERNQVVKFARDVRRRGGEIIKDAGIVIISKEDTTPMVVTDEFIALFKSQVTRAQIEELNRSNGVEIVRADKFVKNQFLLRTTDNSRADALLTANFYHDNQRLVLFAHPNFWVIYERNETIPTDPLFSNQWQHRNTGASGGTVDADADTSMAWDITMGNPSIVIAVVDNGFDLTHEDLAPNLYTNPGEIAGNGIDDDGNGFIDDVNGWDFIGNDNDPSPVAVGDNHGTAVSGVAAARGNNALGGLGSCPNCRIMTLNVFSNCAIGNTGCTSNVMAFANAIGYAQSKGARIINNSWGQGSSGTAATVVVNAVNNAVTAGSVVFFSGGNSPSSGWCGASYPSLPNVIAVSSSSNRDRRVTGHAFGNCIDILAPTRWGAQDSSPTGTLAITTTDRTGTAGYNNADASCLGGLSEGSNRNYTSCFSGTSSASPLAAGIGGLILSANSSLTPLQVRQLLQDTGDKIEDSIGSYAEATGFSTPVSGIATHSYGRINAFEAVRIAAAAPLGKAGVDIFIRDNRLDWGNTEQPSNTLFEPTRGFIPHWQSVDIKVDAPPYQTAPTNNAAFEAFTDENAESGSLNKVYVRVRNRGPVTATSVTVKLHWAFAGAGLPALPGDFWSAFPADSSNTTIWNPLGVQPVTNLAYSGSSVANTSSDGAQIVAFDFNGPPLDPTATDPNHFCLFAVLNSSQDLALPKSRPTIPSDFVPDMITPTDNNVTHRNISVVDSVHSDTFIDRLYVANPTRETARAVIRLDAPRGWKVTSNKFKFNKPFSLKPSERVLVTFKVIPPPGRVMGTLTFIQETTVGKTKIVGGMTYRFGLAKNYP